MMVASYGGRRWLAVGGGRRGVGDCNLLCVWSHPSSVMGCCRSELQKRGGGSPPLTRRWAGFCMTQHNVGALVVVKPGEKKLIARIITEREISLARQYNVIDQG
ncbi:CBS domain-containing protein [Striga asiatica]|uniref:CBS domain-containing protein n=1 Tax=Striga asiatica TaxID=4170 RepID=A0A5A7PEP2_STRAF|nr:CBS domain-containing protein [Striga asiatica]